jgi:hypothetical protein
VIIQCENREQYELLARQPLTIPLHNLRIDIDQDFISQDIAEQFYALGNQEPARHD